MQVVTRPHFVEVRYFQNIFEKFQTFKIKFWQLIIIDIHEMIIKILSHNKAHNIKIPVRSGNEL